MDRLDRTRQVYAEAGARTVIYRGLKYNYDLLSPYLKPLLGDELYLKLYMYMRLGYWPQIRPPRTFNEKILYRKLFSDNELFSIVEDKWRVRDYVADKVGEEVLADIYHVTDDPETIPFTELPASYVIKPTHMSGPIIFIDENEEPDRRSIKQSCQKWLDETYGERLEEYWYEQIKPRIIIEERLQDEEYGIPPDFKFFVFHGEVKYIEVDTDRHTDHKRRFYDTNWNPQEFELKFPLGPIISKPRKLREMINIAESLGEKFEFIRVDLYQINEHRVVFGEITVAHGSGGERFKPKIYDFEFGSLW
jgi:hypothetical protein